MIKINQEEGERLAQENRCAECGENLTCAWGGMWGIEGYVVRCLKDPHHIGITKPVALTKAPGRLVTEAGIGALSLDVFAAMVATRFDRIEWTRGSLNWFLHWCLLTGLDPIEDEVVPTEFKNRKTGKKAIVPIIREDGYARLAAEACPEDWNGPPAAEPVTDPAVKEAWGWKPEDWVWKVWGRRKNWEPGREYTEVWGYPRKEHDALESDYLPAKRWPANQGLIRALKRWYRKAYPEARHKIRQARAEALAQSAGVAEAEEVIEAEYRVFEEGEPGAGRPKERRLPAAKGKAPAKQEAKPQEKRISPFWQAMGKRKVSEETVWATLKVKSLEEWVGGGHTLEEAVAAIDDALAKAGQGPKEETPGAPGAPKATQRPRNLEQLRQAAERMGIPSKEVPAIAGVSSWMDIADAGDAYDKLVASLEK